MDQRPVMIITGATSGIGQATALALAERGAHLGIVARNPAKAEATKAEIERAAPGTPVDVFLADLAVQADVRRAAEEIEERYEHINVLVNNAGINPSRQHVTVDGLSELVAVNYVATWLLTNLLRDRLVKSVPARVVNLSSEAHRMGWTVDPVKDLRDTEPFGRLGGQRAYGKSKLMDLLFTMELARRLDGTGVTANCCCPGMVATNLVGEESPVTKLGERLSGTFLIRRPEQGARIVVRLATDPELAGVSGRFFTSTPGARLMPMIPSTRDAHLQRRLWEATAELVGVDG